MYQYKYYNSDTTVVALSTFAGRTVRGVAKLDPEDTFSLDTGKKIATARCSVKIATKRLKRAEKRLAEVQAARRAAEKLVEDMTHYYNDSVVNLAAQEAELKQILDSIAP